MPDPISVCYWSCESCKSKLMRAVLVEMRGAQIIYRCPTCAEPVIYAKVDGLVF